MLVTGLRVRAVETLFRGEAVVTSPLSSFSMTEEWASVTGVEVDCVVTSTLSAVLTSPVSPEGSWNQEAALLISFPVRSCLLSMVA